MRKKLFNDTKVGEHNIIWCLTHYDKLHPQLNSILGVFLYDIDNQEYSYLNFSHPDLARLNKTYYLDKIFTPSSFIFSKKEILHMRKCDSVDIDSLYYFENTSEIPYESLKTNAHTFFERKYQTNKVNNIIPIAKHLEYFKKLVETVLPLISDKNEFYSDKITNVLYNLEKNSIKIDKRKFDKFFELEYEKNNLKENQLYPYYKPYSTTGRFICSYNGLNLQTLNKDDGSKEAFIPNNDYFIVMDFDGYHIRLIGNLIGYKFNKDNVHQYLAKKYFGEDLTETQLKESKELTFRQLYGGIFAKYLHIDFFKKTQEYIDDLWKIFNIQGYVETPLAKRKLSKDHIKNCTPQKLLNYMIQAYETERNTLVLDELFIYLSEYKTRVCLYIYDAFVIDVDASETKILNKIKDILSGNGQFPVKIKQSKTLNNFKSFQL